MDGADVTVVGCQKVNGEDRYLVSFSNGEEDTYSAEEVFSFGLYEEGKACVPCYPAVREAILVQRARRQVMPYVSLALRTAAQTDAKLEQLGFPETVRTIVLEKLTEEKYLDDFRYCAKYVESAQKTRVVSTRLLIAELQQRGISAEQMEAYFAAHPLDEFALIRRAADKKRRTSPDISPEKLMRFLAGKGFSVKDIYNVVQDRNGGEDE